MKELTPETIAQAVKIAKQRGFISIDLIKEIYPNEDAASLFLAAKNEWEESLPRNTFLWADGKGRFIAPPKIK